MNMALSLLLQKINGPSEGNEDDQNAVRNINGHAGFMTNIKVIKSKSYKELEGKELDLWTYPFDKNHIGTEVELSLIRNTQIDDKSDWWLICSGIDMAVIMAAGANKTVENNGRKSRASGTRLRKTHRHRSVSHL